MHLPRHEALFLICFAVVSVLGLVPVLILEGWANNKDSPVSTIVAVIQGMSWVAVVSVAFTFAAVEGVTMLAERYLKARKEEGRQEGRQEERRELARRLASMTPEEREAEFKRLMAENGKPEAA